MSETTASAGVPDSSATVETVEAIEGKNSQPSNNVQEVENTEDRTTSGFKPRTFKVNGKEIVVNSPEKMEEFITKYIPLGISSTERFQNASKMTKDADEILSALKQKNLDVLIERAGLSQEDYRALLEEKLKSIYDYEDMDPNERQRREMENKLRKFEEQEESRKTKEHEELLARQQEEYIQQIESDLVDALSGSGKLPSTPLMAKLALQYMSAYAANEQELSPSDAVKMVESDFPRIVQDIMSNMDVTQLKNFIGEKHYKALRKDAISTVRKAEEPFSKPSSLKPTMAENQDFQSEEKNSKKYTKSDDFFKNLRGF